MRIWDIHPRWLCKKHLLGEHRELHTIWNVITQNKKGYSRHPETLRWVGNLQWLWRIHSLIVLEFQRKKYNHKSPLDYFGEPEQYPKLITPIEDQIKHLNAFKCECCIPCVEVLE